MKYILCFSGGKDSLAMLIHVLTNKLPLDEVLYVDMGEWMWQREAADVLIQVNELFNVDITRISVYDEIKKGFRKWGFPSFINRWCTGIKREAMKKYLKKTYDDEEITQYIGYCADEAKRTSKKLYSSYEVSYPLVDAGITTTDAKKICEDYGFNFGGVYEHHSHFNCWLCPLQRKKELNWIFEHDKEKWEYLRKMQLETDGYYYPKETVFDLEKQFWLKNIEFLKARRQIAKKIY